MNAFAYAVQHGHKECVLLLLPPRESGESHDSAVANDVITKMLKPQLITTYLRENDAIRSRVVTFREEMKQAAIQRAEREKKARSVMRYLW